MLTVNLAHSASRLGGGLFVSVRMLTKQLSALEGLQVEVVVLEDAFTREDRHLWAPVPVHACAVLGPTRFGYAPCLGRILDEISPDLLHCHGAWKFPSLACSRWAKRSGKPYIVSPHGMLEPWALGQSRHIKSAAMRLYEGRHLQDAACIRATSISEAEAVRRIGINVPIAVVPHGIEVPLIASQQENLKPDSNCRVALFLSRIHPKKGLRELITAWDRLRPKGWELIVSGPDEKGHLAEIAKMVRSAGLEKVVRFEPPSWGDARWELYRSADLFILPSHSENFGLVIGEALGCGVPVVTTRATPWMDLEVEKCGWWIESGVEPLTAALETALGQSPSTLAEMGTRGRNLVRRKYSWPAIAFAMATVYRWVTAGTPPQCPLL